MSSQRTKTASMTRSNDETVYSRDRERTRKIVFVSLQAIHATVMTFRCGNAVSFSTAELRSIALARQGTNEAKHTKEAFHVGPTGWAGRDRATGWLGFSPEAHSVRNNCARLHDGVRRRRRFRICANDETVHRSSAIIETSHGTGTIVPERPAAGPRRRDTTGQSRHPLLGWGMWSVRLFELIVMRGAGGSNRRRAGDTTCE